MDIGYIDKTIEKNLKDQRSIAKRYGKIAKALMHRLSDLRVADNLSQISHLPPPRRHKLSGRYDDCWGIDLSKNMRLIIRPIGEFDPKDLATITGVCIVDIQDYH